MRKSVVLKTAALVMILAGFGSQPARADRKADFKKGGEEGHGSYVETVDNVKCNTSGGTTITCDYQITSCTASAQAIHIKHIPATAGVLQNYMTGKARLKFPPPVVTMVRPSACHSSCFTCAAAFFDLKV